jgi:hypothetical protein
LLAILHSLSRHGWWYSFNTLQNIGGIQDDKLAWIFELRSSGSVSALGTAQE